MLFTGNTCLVGAAFMERKVSESQPQGRLASFGCVCWLSDGLIVATERETREEPK